MTLEQARAIAAEVERRHHAERRFTGNGICVIDGTVIYDGEAEALGVEPLTRWPPPTRRAHAAPETSDGPKARGKGRGRTAPPVADRGPAAE